MADNSAEPTSAFDGVTVAAVPLAVIHKTDVLLLPRFFLMVALKENLQENAHSKHLEGFWDRLIEILEEIRQAVSKIEGGSKLEDGILRATDVVDTKLVPYLHSVPNVDRMLESYLPPKGQTWEDFLQGKPEHERKLAMAELDIQGFHDHLPDIVLLYMDQFLKDVIEFRRFIAGSELLPTDEGDQLPVITPYSICPELLPTEAGDRLPDVTPYSICPELLPTDEGDQLPDITPYSIGPATPYSFCRSDSASIPSFQEGMSFTRVTEVKRAKSTTIAKYYKIVKVYYATDRKLVNDEYKYDDLPLFDWQFPGWNAGNSTPASVPADVALPPLRPLEYGIVEVSIPSIHKPGVVESPQPWEKKDPSKYVLILPNDKKLRGKEAEGEFFTILNKDISGEHGLNTEGDLLIFIHGYSNTHDDALKKAAQLKFDMGFKGAMVAYTWSSAGNRRGYYHDEVAIENTVQSLKGFLLAIMVEMKVHTRIHLLAHSMGNRAMIKALDLLHDEHQIPNLPHPRCPIATVISAAGDDRPVHWEDLLAKMKKAYPPNAEGKSVSRPLLSVYSSNEDWALKVSHGLHLEVRLGETSRLFKSLVQARMPTPDDYDAIDATGVDTKFFTTGHGYFGDAPKVIEDIYALITKSVHANGRGLVNVQNSGFKFFVFIKNEWLKFINLPDSLLS